MAVSTASTFLYRRASFPGGSSAVADGGADYQGETETVSYNLFVELIELYCDLAEERLKVGRAEKWAARRQGEKSPQARRSASAIVREAKVAHQAKVEEELRQLRKR